MLQSSEKAEICALPGISGVDDEINWEVRNLQVMQVHPGRSAEELKHLADLERSARAQVKLRLKALAHARAYKVRAKPRRHGRGSGSLNQRRLRKSLISSG